VRELLDAAELAGVRGAKVLAEAHFDATRLEQHEASATIEELDLLVDAAIALTGDPAFGLRWGESTSGVRYGVLAPLVATSRTLRDAIDAMARFQRIVSEVDEVGINHSSEGLELRWTAPATSPTAERARKELVVVGFVRMVRLFIGRSDALRTVAFDYPPPPYADAYVPVFDGQARFRAPWSGIEVPTHLLDVPQPGWNEELNRVMLGHAEAALAGLDGRHSQRDRVTRVLLAAVPRWLDMSEVAAALSMSERTLRRHLTREGVTFADVLADAQRDTALRLLRDPARNVQQVAYEMGFSSASAFNRAFKRWTGHAPSEIRRGSERPGPPGR
jgi:AraC-like DNA-binding protein